MKGYAVIFLHRDESLKPFERKFSNLFQLLRTNKDTGVVEGKFFDTYYFISKIPSNFLYISST